MADGLKDCVREYFDNKDKLRKASESKLTSQEIMIIKLRLALLEKKIKEMLNENKGE